MLAREQYIVDLVYLNRGKQWADFDKPLLHKLKLSEVKVVNIYIKNLLWLSVSLIDRILKLLSKNHYPNPNLRSLSLDKGSIFLLLVLLQMRRKYDHIIGHSFGAIYPAYFYAKKSGTAFSIDIEDYHPGEFLYSENVELEKKGRESVLITVLSKARSVTYASPLIREKTLNLLNLETALRHFVVNNSFLASEFTFSNQKKGAGETVHFVWFSQNITMGRGVELVIEALSMMQNVQLTLIGQISKEFEREIPLSKLPWIEVIAPLSQAELHRRLADYDVGLACDLSSSDLNRELALTNKMFAYCQAGLFILATDTQAQKRFLEEHREMGVVSKQEKEDLVQKISWITKNIGSIRYSQSARFELAKSIAWERESNKLKEVWREII